MGTIGIIGGLGPESTIEYYRLILAFYREQKKDGSNPPILINSVNMKRLLDLITAGELREAAGYLVEEVERLAKAGASFRCRRFATVCSPRRRSVISANTTQRCRRLKAAARRRSASPQGFTLIF